MGKYNFRSSFSIGLLFLVLANLDAGKQVHAPFLVCSIAWVALAIFEFYRELKDS